MSSELRLDLLGGLQIMLDGRSLAGDLSVKGQALLCYLAVEDRVHPRQGLASLLWGDFSETDAATSLRQVLAQLRRALGSCVAITRQTVTINRDILLRVDSTLFEEGLTIAQSTSDVERLRSAVELYRGDFLAGFNIRDAPDFDDWAALQRERLRLRAINAFHSIAQHTAHEGEYAAAILYTTRLLQFEPWREEAHRRLMWLYVRSGQRSAALAQYQTCRRILAEELGVEPMEETSALYERIKAAHASRTSVVPPPASPFVGRAAELAVLTRRLADPACRLVTITGPGGIGKTRLALHVTANAAASFLHGVHVVPLVPVSSEEALISALATAAGCVFRGTDNPRTQLLTYLADKDMLLVLDNFEQLVDHGTGLLVDVLHSAPEVKLLITSRERLQLQDEWLIELDGLEVPPSGTTEACEMYSAVELFCRRAGRISADFAFDDVDREAVVRICRLVEGLPLGIELAAAWVRVLSTAEIAQEIERSLEFLSTSAPDTPARHRNLHAVFDHSWRLLTDTERQVSRRLAVFRGGCTRDAVVQVAGGSVSVLRALVDKSLLRKSTTTAPAAETPRLTPVHYDMHELVRLYALEKLEQAAEHDATCRRHLHFFLQLAETAGPQLAGPEQPAWLDRLEREHDNLRAALEWGLRPDGTCDDSEKAARLGTALWRFWWLHAHFREGSRWLTVVLEHEGLPPAVRAAALHGCGVLLQEQGVYARAQLCYEESLGLRRKLGDIQGIAASLNSLGVIALDQEDYASARAHIEESVALKRKLGDSRGIAGSLNNLGMVVSALGDHVAARRLYEESLQTFREMDHKTGVAVTIGNLAAIALDQQDPEAQRLFSDSLVLFQELGESDGIAECLEGLAGVAMMQRRPRRAARLCGAAAALRDTIGAPLIPIERARYERILATARDQLDEAAFMSAFSGGHELPVEQAVAYALAPDPDEDE